MMVPNDFPSWRNFLSFATAREFVLADTGQPYPRNQENWLEYIGHAVSRPLINPIHFVMVEIRNPLMIMALMVTAIFVATFLFYPVQFMAVATTILPFLGKISPWMIRKGAFIAVETTIMAIGLRALGRMHNATLRADWAAGRLLAIPIGASIQRV